MKQRILALWICGVVAGLVGMAMGQDQPSAGDAQQTPTRIEALSRMPGQDMLEDPASPLLGEPWESMRAGIKFRPPRGMQEIRTALGEGEIVEFFDLEKDWVLKLAESRWNDPQSLRGHRDQAGIERPGLLEMTLSQLRQANPGAEILRTDVVHIGEAEVGLIAMRYAQGTARRLTQLALVEAPGNRLYYIFNLTTPGAEDRPRVEPQPQAGDQPADGPEDQPTTAAADQADLEEPQEQEDPRERQAVETMAALLDTVKLLDRQAVKIEQDQRLFRTRMIYAQWNTQQVQKALVGEQWLRVLRNGKDVGYTYVVEKPETRGEIAGAMIGMRSHTVTPAGLSVDVETWMFASADRSHESWTTVARSKDSKGNEDFITEIGTSDQIFQRYPLTVRTIARRGNFEPVEQEVPPFYLPQAMGHLLPRLLPLREAKPDRPVQFMFAFYVPDQRKVMARYVDVLVEQEVTFNGQKMWAVPIRDRIGWEGTVTTHYMTSAGKYLGSETTIKEYAAGQTEPRQVRITVLPTDAQTLNKIWDKPDLTAPERHVDEPQPRPRDTVRPPQAPPRGSGAQDRSGESEIMERLRQQRERARPQGQNNR